MSCEMRSIILVVPESTAADGHHAGMARMGGRQTAREHHFLASQALLRARESTLHLCIRNQNALEREIAAKNSCKERANDLPLQDKRRMGLGSLAPAAAGIPACARLTNSNS